MLFIESEAKSIVIYTNDDSYKSASNIMSVEVNERFFANILKLVEEENRIKSMVSRFDGVSEFLRFLAGEDCKCQCMCCSETTPVYTPPTKTVTKSIPTKITKTIPTVTKTAARTTPRIDVTKTKTIPTKTATRTTPRTDVTKIKSLSKTATKTATKTIPTKSVTRTTPRTDVTKIFSPPPYLPVGKPITGSRAKTTTRTFKVGTFKQFFTIGVGPAWIPPSRRPTSSRTTITTVKYEYAKPSKEFEFY